jgi:XisI protein
MDKLNHYRQIVQRILTEHSQVKSVFGEIEMGVVFERFHFTQPAANVVMVGLRNSRRVSQITPHHMPIEELNDLAATILTHASGAIENQLLQSDRNIFARHRLQAEYQAFPLSLAGTLDEVASDLSGLRGVQRLSVRFDC